MSGKSTDVVVIGAGVAGCAVARELARRRVRVTVLERSVAGAEASSAAAGILGAQVESDEPGAFCDLAVRSRALYAGFAEALEEESGVRTGYARCGSILLAFNEAEEKELRSREKWQGELGLKTQWLDRKSLEEIEPEGGIQARAGLRFEDDGQIEPPQLARALARAALMAGAKFLTTTVRRILHDESRVRGVETAEGVISCERVVLAAGAWTTQVPGSGLRPEAVAPVRGQVIALDHQPGALSHVLVRHGHGYVVPRPNGQIITGSTAEKAGFNKAVTAGGVRKILDVALTIAPSLVDARYDNSWSNFRPTTPDRLPLLGEGAIKGLHFASGHFRNGILLTPVTAELIADEITGKKPEIDLAPFSPKRFAQ